MCAGMFWNNFSKMGTSSPGGGWLATFFGEGAWPICYCFKADLEFQYDEPSEMPIAWITAQTLLYLWEVRMDGKIASLIITRAKLESKISLWRETIHQNEYTLMQEMLEINVKLAKKEI